ncbi:MAG: aldo/keto reductase [Nitrospinae bacterium]|nr:aldo/keto reductase [Nitrospinota bacterium]
METRQLAGGSKISVTPLTLGTWRIGGAPFWAPQDSEISVQAIQTAIGAGINCIDTAPVYGMGLAEELIGKAIAGRRDKVVLATKCGLKWKDATIGGIYKDLTPQSITQELEDSLKRLGTDRVEIYQIHWPDPATPIADTMNALIKMKEQGKILEIGVSNFTLEQLQEAIGIAPIACVQPKYNVLEREIEADLLPFCAQNHIGVLAYSPLASGVLSGKYGKDTKFDDWRDGKNFGIFRPETFVKGMDQVERLKEVAEDYGMTLPQLAIRWLVEQKGVTSAIVGCNNPEQVEENVTAVSLRIDSQFLTAIDTALAG